MQTNSDVRVLSGNEACAEGALAAGVRFFAGYPITPSTEIAEVMSYRLPQIGGTFIQMEDEIASLAAVIGASLTGTKSMDATSGPGFSLKAENLGLAVMLEVPLLLVDVMRVGPSTGMATMPAQGDVMMARWGTHGDHPIIALAPWSVQECFDLTVKAINFSERFRTPVLLMSDAIIGRMREKLIIPDKIELWERPRPTVPPNEYLPYKAGPDGVPPMADYGAGYFWYANSSMHNEAGAGATENSAAAKDLMDRLLYNIDRCRDEVVMVQEEMLEDADVAVFAYGSVARTARAAVKAARAQGIKAGLFRPQTLWPFPDREVEALGQRVKHIVVAEMNMGQMVSKVREFAGRCAVSTVLRYDGRPITPEQILEGVKEQGSGVKG
jgi:2-oxoglutarate/2-oxoacid ferredoxin oxidoreductase subunit alpha